MTSPKYAFDRILGIVVDHSIKDLICDLRDLGSPRRVPTLNIQIYNTIPAVPKLSIEQYLLFHFFDDVVVISRKGVDLVISDTTPIPFRNITGIECLKGL